MQTGSKIEKMKQILKTCLLLERELSSQSTHIRGNDGTVVAALYLSLLCIGIFSPVGPKSEFWEIL